MREQGFYLVVRDSPRTGLNDWNALEDQTLGDLLGKCNAEKIVLLIDTCYSGEGAKTIAHTIDNKLASKPSLPGQQRCIGVLSSAHALKKAPEAVFCRALREVLTAPTPRYRAWSDQDEWIGVYDVFEALAKTFKAMVDDERPDPYCNVRGLEYRFLPNPRYRSSLPIDVETGRKLLSIPEPLKLAARGADVGEAGFYFTGRIALRKKLASWIGQPQPGIAIVTGPAGSGKSAVIGKLLLSSDKAFQAEAARRGLLVEDPLYLQLRPGAVLGAVHARGKSVEDFVPRSATSLV